VRQRILLSKRRKINPYVGHSQPQISEDVYGQEYDPDEKT